MKQITAKNFSDLSETKQAEFILKEKNSLLQLMIEDSSFFSHSGLENNIQKAIAKSEAFQTPWFLGEILMEDKEIASFIHESAVANLEETLFVERSNVAVMVI